MHRERQSEGSRFLFRNIFLKLSWRGLTRPEGEANRRGCSWWHPRVTRPSADDRRIIDTANVFDSLIDKKLC
jgi:hypothetical protein